MDGRASRAGRWRPHDEGFGAFVDRPGWRKAAGHLRTLNSNRALTPADILLCEVRSICGDAELRLRMSNLQRAQRSGRYAKRVHVRAKFIKNVLGQFIGESIKEPAYRDH